MNKTLLLPLLGIWATLALPAQNVDLKISENLMPSVSLDGKPVLKAPEEGLWSVSTAWENDWMAQWSHAKPTEQLKSGETIILKGAIKLPGGEMLVRDAYTQVKPDLIRCVRRYEWKGEKPLEKATLSVRYEMEGTDLKPFMPGIMHYGNLAGAKVNEKVIPVYRSTPGEFAIFEDHRYSMPFTMLESAKDKHAVAVHTTPSPVRGATLSDQWWSLGVEAKEGKTDFVLYSGPIGYNREHSEAKALQQKPMKYTDTYITMDPGQVIEKEFFLEAYPLTEQGNGFQKPIYTSMDLHRPYDYNRFPTAKEIVKTKYNFALTRWADDGKGVAGFCMYPGNDNDFVMGWAGQSDALGYALQSLDGTYLNDPTIADKVQKTLDFLTTCEVREDGLFPVGYSIKNKKYHGGDPISCGNAMYVYAKAIEAARKNKKYDTSKWEAFLKKACDGTAKRMLDEKWNPRSTNEAFCIAPLAIAAELFDNETYKKAAVKAGEVYAKRHLSMEEPYWGGTLDATCEDKEGAWAAFQAFLELYKRFEDPTHLKWAKHAMDVALSYTVVWDIPLPPGRMADHNFKTTGWTVVSAQNQHIDVYGVMFTPEIYQMGEYLKDQRLKDLAKVMYRTSIQLTDPFGSQGEQLQQTNFAQHGDMSNVHKLRGGYSEGWTVFWITAHFLSAAARFEEMGVDLDK